jgi:F-type H+-transporting ATPase subunit delta
MIEPITLARPYARAAFSFAQQQGQLDAWLTALTVLGQIASDPRVGSLLRDPSRTGTDRAQTLIDVAAGSLPEGTGNFLQLLAENGRLLLLSDIAALFAEFKANVEATISVDVTSAFALSDEDKQRLADTMAKRLARTVSITTHTDPALVGGAVIRAGDLVIDGSVRGRLTKLASALAP